MTKQDWHTMTDIVAMLRYLGPRYTLRQARLFAVACCRASERLLKEGSDQVWHSLLALEQQAEDDQPVEMNVRAWTNEQLNWYIDAAYFSPQRFAAIAVRQLLRIERHSGASNVTPSNAMWPLQQSLHHEQPLLNGLHNHAELAYLESNVDLLREIVGDPTRPVTIEPAWRTANVLGVATMIHQWHAYENLPILGDALMDAGCDDEQIIEHCQQPTKHVRGCWLLEAVLSRS